MKFSVRQAKYQDAKDIADLHVESWKIAYKGLIHQSYLDNGLDKTVRQARWEDSLGKTGKDYEIYVAETDNRIIGFADIGASRDENRKDYAEIYAIYVHPDYYGRGAGRLLFNACHEKMKDINRKKLFVWVLEGNKRGIEFYERMGAFNSTAEKTVTVDGKNYREIRYEWKDLT